MPIVNANGIDIHYQERGEGDPLILIMGLSADGSVWEEHAKAYEKHFRCILVDNRGVGKTDKPVGPYTTETMANDVAGLMDAIGIEQARIAGISMGGAIAQQLALNHPDKVRSQILCCTWAECDQYAKDIFNHFKLARATMRFEDFMMLLQLWIFTAPFYENAYDALLQGRADAAIVENPQPQHGFEAQADACITHNTVGKLGNIKTPTLITVGENDIFTPLKFSEYIHENIEGSELFVMPNCGHAHHWEDLESFNSKTTEFLLAH